MLDFIEGNNDPRREMGEEGSVSGGVFDQSTHEEDGPVIPRFNRGTPRLSSTQTGFAESR